MDASQSAIQLGFQSLKAKIGVLPETEEQRQVRALLASLPPRISLRLDANAGLTPTQLKRWEASLRHPQLAFVEQPLPPGQEAEMAAWARCSQIPVGLDESVCRFADLERISAQFPEFVFVLKTGILGNLESFFNWRRQHHPPLTLVHSSVLETAVGARMAALVALSDPGPQLPVGFGTGGLFTEDGLGHFPVQPQLIASDLPQESEASAWASAIGYH